MNTHDTTKGRFLVVDDEEHIREILSATLAPLALSVHTAGSAEEALDVRPGREHRHGHLRRADAGHERPGVPAQGEGASSPA